MDFNNLTSLGGLPIDLVIIILVLLAGQFQKHYLSDVFPKVNGAMKTLATSAVFTLIYALMIWVAGKFTRELPLNWFFSYTVATSLYELLFKKLSAKYFPEDTTVKLLILVCFMPALMSCSTVKKTQRESLVLTSSATQVKEDSAHVISDWSNTELRSNSIALNSMYSYTDHGISLIFDSTSEETAEPVVIKKTDTSVSVNTGKRKLKQMFLNDEKQTQKTDSTSQVKDSTVISYHTDSLFTSEDVARFDEEERSYRENVKDAKRLAFGLVIIIAICIAFLVTTIISVRKRYLP